jgi:predicted TIM-barrel fold metal-dependent hydrolase
MRGPAGTSKFEVRSSKWIRLFVAIAVTAGFGCARGPAADSRDPGADPALRAFIENIRAVDNHTHANSTAPNDADYDALPLDGIAPFDLPVRLRADNPEFAAAATSLRGGRDTMKADFPTWVLDRVGTDVLLANRIAMGPGLAAPRFRWVSYVDALMLPLATQAVAATTPDRQKLFPLEDALLKRYLTDLHLAAVPRTLDEYLSTVVTPTLESQRRAGCVAVKFEAAYLRALDFEDATMEAARPIYARFAGGGVPTVAEYKIVQDFLFRFIGREAGRLGMAVHIHSFEGVGNYFDIAGADPLKLQPALDDPSLRQTNFVIIHGGGLFASHTSALLWRSNVFTDTSLMTLAYSPARLAAVIEEWVSAFPEKVLFGSDATAISADMGWDVAAWVGTRTTRDALAIALTHLMREGMPRARAEEIATMVMRGNAVKLYQLR